MATTTKPKFKTFNIADIYPVDYSRNWRDPSGATYKTEDLKPDIKAFGGLRTHPLYHLKNGKFDRIIRGHRRTTAIGELNKEEPHDDRWKMIEAEVVENLTEQEIVDLMVDVGTTKDPEKYEIVRLAFMEYDANPMVSYADLTFKLLGLLDKFWPIPKKETKSREEILKFHHGKIQNILIAAQLPKIGRDLYYNAVRDGEALSFQKKKFAEMLKAHKKDMASDPSVGFDNPGPEYMAQHNQLVDELETAAAEGRAPKAVGMLSKDKVQTLYDNCPSVGVKMVLAYIMQSQPNINTYNKVVQILAKLETEDVKKQLLATREEQPAAAQPAAAVAA